jgi:hypothetical protein
VGIFRRYSKIDGQPSEGDLVKVLDSQGIFWNRPFSAGQHYGSSAFVSGRAIDETLLEKSHYGKLIECAKLWD